MNKKGRLFSYYFSFPSIRFLFNCNIMEHTEIRVITWVLTKIVVN